MYYVLEVVVLHSIFSWSMMNGGSDGAGFYCEAFHTKPRLSWGATKQQQSGRTPPTPIPLFSLNVALDSVGGDGDASPLVAITVMTTTSSNGINGDDESTFSSELFPSEDDPHEFRSVPQNRDSPITTNNNENSVFWMNVGAAITQESCPLLGIKTLGVDYGLVRTGIAVTVGYEPQPLAIVQASSDAAAVLPNTATTIVSNSTAPDDNATAAAVAIRQMVCETVVKYAAAQQVQRIVVGLPLHKNGTTAEQTIRTLEFGQQLAVTVLSQLGPSVPIVMFDERYTSKEAAARARASYSSQSRQSLYGTLDAAAAAIILENYYQDGGVGAQTMHVQPDDVRQACLEQYAQRVLALERDRQAAWEATAAKLRRRKDARTEASQEAEQAKRSSRRHNDDKIKKKKKKKKKN